MSQPPIHQARKRFGQNFLHDLGVIQGIVRAVHPQPEEHLLEIGPGQGALTQHLLGQSARLDLIELDRDLTPLLIQRFSSIAGLQIHQGDILEYDLAKLTQQAKSLRVVGNLPYNISTPLIFHLLGYAELIQDMHFMLQKEVVNRLAATPGNKDWGRLSLMVQYHCQVEPLFEVPPEAFTPAPKVTSSVVRLVPYLHPPCPTRSPELLAKVVRLAFNQRRKTIRNALKDCLCAAQIEAAGVDSGQRPEQLDLAAFVRLADQLVSSPAPAATVTHS